LKYEIVSIIILISALLLGCSKDVKEDSLNGLWIGNLITYLEGDRFEIIGYRGIDPLEINPEFDSTDTITENMLFEFFKDSMYLAIFDEDYYGGIGRHSIEFKIRNDSILIPDSVANDTSVIIIEKLQKNEIILSYQLDDHQNLKELNKYYLKPVCLYKQKDKYDQLRMFLTTNRIKVSISETIWEFSEGHHERWGDFCTYDSREKFGEKNVWSINKVKNELFLLLGKYVIQIKEVSDSEVIGIIHPSKKEVIFNMVK